MKAHTVDAVDRRWLYYHRDPCWSSSFASDSQGGVFFQRGFLFKPWALETLFACIVCMGAHARSSYATGQEVSLCAAAAADPLACSKAHWKAMKKILKPPWD
jgi:hypothetical protein